MSTAQLDLLKRIDDMAQPVRYYTAENRRSLLDAVRDLRGLLEPPADAPDAGQGVLCPSCRQPMICRRSELASDNVYEQDLVCESVVEICRVNMITVYSEPTLAQRSES